MTLNTDEVNGILRDYGPDWRVHTINRNPGASVVDILLERPVR